MTNGFDPIRSLGARVAGDVAGDVATLLLPSGRARSGVILHNASTTLEIWVRIADAADAAPTISANDRDFVVPPKATLVLDAAEGIAIYGVNSTGLPTNSPYAATEVMR